MPGLTLAADQARDQPGGGGGQHVVPVDLAPFVSARRPAQVVTTPVHLAGLLPVAARQVAATAPFALLSPAAVLPAISLAVTALVSVLLAVSLRAAPLVGGALVVAALLAVGSLSLALLAVGSTGVAGLFSLSLLLAITLATLSVAALLTPVLLVRLVRGLGDGDADPGDAGERENRRASGGCGHFHRGELLRAAPIRGSPVQTNG